MNCRGVGRRRVRAQRMYQLLVWLYPAAHRRAFGQQMVQAFGDHYRDAVQCRGGSPVRFWLAVLTDAGSSLLTEHAAEARARGRRMAKAARRRRKGVTRHDSPRRAAPRGSSVRALPGLGGGEGGGMNRRTRVRRGLRYRGSSYRPVRVVVRTRHRRLEYRGRTALLAVMAVLVGVALGVGTVTGHLGVFALVAGLVVAAWLGYGIRLTRPVPAGPRGDGPAPPGGACVREPRHPLPMSPAGSAARSRLESDPPGQAVTLR